MKWNGRMYYMNGEKVYDMIYDEMRQDEVYDIMANPS